jgi:hypothetical protein
MAEDPVADANCYGFAVFSVRWKYHVFVRPQPGVWTCLSVRRPTARGTFAATARHLDWQRSINAANPQKELVWGIQQVHISVV